MDKTEPRKIQRRGSVQTLLTPNDKLTKCIFHRDADKYAAMLGGKPADVNEGFTYRRKKLLTRYWLELADGFTDVTPPDEFDRAVLDACISAQAAGYVAIAFTEINRLISGGKFHSTNLYPSRKKRIVRAVERLMCTRISVDFSELAKTGKYPKLPQSGRLTDMLLPCQILEGVLVNGQSVDAVVFRGESPLLILARGKNQQLLSYPVELLDVPNQNNTELVTKLKSYITRRVHEVKAHKEMTPKITFADVFEKCGLADANASIRQNARKIVRDVFEHLKTQNVVLNFTVKKEKGRYRAINFTY